MSFSRVVRNATILMGTSLLLFACARSGKPVLPIEPVPIKIDSAAISEALRRDSLARDSVERFKRDSINLADSIRRSDSIAREDSIKLADTTAIKSRKTVSEGKKCILDFRAFDAATPPRLNMISLPSGKSDAFVGGRSVWTCRGDNITLIADSAEYYGDRDQLDLIGNVQYKEPRASLKAQRMTYWTVDGRLLAEQDVFAITDKGATLTGQVAEYFRAIEGIRDQSKIVATMRPVLGMPQKDSVTGEVKDTIQLVADRIESHNDSLVYAFGKVVITRSDIDAESDSAFLDQGKEFARLNGNPVVNAKDGERPFSLKGGVIDMFSRNREVERIVATPNGHVTSEDLELLADSIDMRVKEKKLQKVYAWGPSRARAHSSDHTITADSIEALLPEQRIQELRAIRGAYATTTPDTATIISDEKDWISGDTIIALFDTLTRQDSVLSDTSSQPLASDSSNSKTPPIKSIESITSAKAYYHIKNNKGVREKPGVNYVRGRVIKISFKEREVDSVTVTDKASGVYIEPEDGK